MKAKIAVIGHFGGKKQFFDGQTVKTKNVTKLLETYLKTPIIPVDTYFFKTNKLKLLLDSLLCLLRCDHVFLMVSDRGMQFYLPFLFFINKITKRHIYHYIIGSKLLSLVEENEKLVKYLNVMKVNWFEYESGTQFLREKGVRNAVTLANFKYLSPVTQAKNYESNNDVFHFCTFSRVMEEKGITDAIRAISSINEKFGIQVASLDIYGPVEPKYKEKFESLLQQNQDCVCYKGTVESTNSVEILKDYYALLFPTHWQGEGCPGTVIDAFAAGIPVIASDWNANKELISNGEQGVIYPNKTVTTLQDAVEWSMQHTEEMNRMRELSRREYEKYAPDAVMQVILDKMNEKM